MTTDETVQRFNKSDSDQVLELIKLSDHDEADWSHFGDVDGFDLVTEYLCTVKVTMKT